MKKTVNYLVWSLSKINKTHVQFALMLLMLVMLVLGAGALDDLGGGHR